MNKLICAVSRLQSQINLVPTVLRKVSRDDGTVTFRVYSPGSQREEDIVAFSIVFVTPEDYPSCQAWLVSDNEGINDMLSAVAEEFLTGVTLEDILTRVLTLLGHEPETFTHLFLLNADNDYGDDYDETEELSNEDMGEDGDYYCYDSDVELEEDKELMVELGHKQGRWEKFETEYQASALKRKKAKQELSSKEKVAEDRQIFDTSSAFKLLSNELLSIMKEESCDMVVDTVNDDVYHWNVELAGFHEDSQLAEDLVALRNLYGYSTVQLHVVFKRELHPFYPPKVEVLRPRFVGPVGSAISSHPIFTLRYWDPWRSQKDLLKEIKDFLQQHARVDYESKYNSLLKYPIAAYSPAELKLATLEALSEVLPRWATVAEYRPLYDCRDVHVDSERIAALSQRTDDSGSSAGNSTMGSSKHRKLYWAAGTGFGHGHSKGQTRDVWDPKKATAAQNAHDVEIQSLLFQLTESLSMELKSPSEDSVNEEETVDSVNEPIALIPTLNSSCLVPFLIRELINVSFTNMCERASYYISVIKLIHELCHPVSARMLYSSSTKEKKSVFHCLCDLEDQAKCYAKVINSHAEITKAESLPGSSTPGPSDSRKKIDADEEENLGMSLAQSIMECVDFLRQFRFSDSSEEEKLEEANQEEKEVEEGPSHPADSYESIMKPYQIDFFQDLVSNHAYASDSNREQSFPKDRLVRLGREIAGLKSLLPLNPSSSVFVRIDEEKQTIWTAMIIGPEDTPYSGGCFVFDIYFPTGYPHFSPKVLLKTTGGGKVRFNPNLYKNGKVCLSLLGTWSGASGETWDPNASSVCQVLISIQSLILVNEPYFNEPGYEETMHSESGKNASRRYNQDIREQTIHRAMIEHLRNPTGPFSEAILVHFRLRKNFIVETCKQWIREAEAARDTAHTTRLKSLVSELEKLLNALPQDK